MWLIAIIVLITITLYVSQLSILYKILILIASSILVYYFANREKIVLTELIKKNFKRFDNFFNNRISLTFNHLNGYFNNVLISFKLSLGYIFNILGKAISHIVDGIKIIPSHEEGHANEDELINEKEKKISLAKRILKFISQQFKRVFGLAVFVNFFANKMHAKSLIKQANLDQQTAGKSSAGKESSLDNLKEMYKNNLHSNNQSLAAKIEHHSISSIIKSHHNSSNSAAMKMEFNRLMQNHNNNNNFTKNLVDQINNFHNTDNTPIGENNIIAEKNIRDQLNKHPELFKQVLDTASFAHRNVNLLKASMGDQQAESLFSALYNLLDIAASLPKFSTQAETLQSHKNLLQTVTRENDLTISAKFTFADMESVITLTIATGTTQAHSNNAPNF